MDRIYNNGERFVPGKHGISRIEHYHRYLLGLELVAKSRVLDIACGEGYGSDMLAAAAEHVTGMDSSNEVIQHARSRYTSTNLDFLQGSIESIPCEDDSFDSVISFETIEHISDHEAAIIELRRVLKPNGLLVMSTPEKAFSADVSQHANPFHMKELYADELVSLVSPHFKNKAILTQRIALASEIRPDTKKTSAVRAYDLDLYSEGIGIDQYRFNIVVASNAELPTSSASICLSGAEFLTLSSANEGVYDSVTYKLGNAILSPLKKLRTIFDL